MPQVDAFALKNSDFNAFLFADVGTELNGSTLTILSILARSGKDPWAEAARWGKLPVANAIDCLAQSIARMPLGPQSIAGARGTAAQLVLLLPTPHLLADLRGGRTHVIRPTSTWVSMALMVCALIFGLAMNAMMFVPKQVAGAPGAAAQMVQAAPASRPSLRENRSAAIQKTFKGD